MMRARHWCLLLLIAAFVAVTVWWCVHVPYRPDRLFRAIPAQATFVSRHMNLRERWDRIYANPLVLSLFMSAGVKPAALKEWAENQEIRRWFNRLAGRDVVVAYVPPRTTHADPAWVVASWLGGDSQRLRWQMAWQRSKEFEPRPPHHGHQYWRVVSRDIEPGIVLTVALVEGMLIGCLADREEAIIEVLDAFDGLRPSMGQRVSHAVFTPAHTSRNVEDAVWLDTERMIGLRGSRKYPLGIEFREISHTSLACRAYFVDTRAPQAKHMGDTSELKQVLGDAPVWAAGFPLSWLAGEREASLPVWQSALLRIARDQQADAAVIALLGKRYAGRIAGISVPAVVAALPLTQPERAPQQMQAALDDINASSRWGLIPYPWMRVGQVSVVVIEGTGQNRYASLAPEEKPAYAVSGSWLFLAAQAAILKTLLEQSSSPTNACWHQAVRETAPLWVWGDFRLGNDALRLALSAYAFKLIFEDAVGTQRQRQRLNEWKAWLDAFEPLEQCAIRAEPWDSNGLAVEVTMGRFCP